MAENRTDPETSTWELWLGIAFWVVILGGALGWYLHEDHADVLLDVTTQPELVGGIVSFEGAPLHGGVVRVEVVEAGNNRYRGGVTLAVGQDGTFTSRGQPTLGIEKDKPPLRVVAVFRGTRGEKDNAKPLTGEATIYLNSPPPLGEHFLKGLLIVVMLLLAIQLFLFTGDLGRGKARALFILMYLFTFLSIVMPIAVSLIVAKNQYLVDAMEVSPIGLVKAKTKVLTEPQWLINIGGTVVREQVAATITRTPSERPREPAAKAEPVIGTEVSNDTLASLSANTGQLLRIEGGIAVPFFVVLLAMFGAGINMTLKVPDIQRSYEDVPPEPTRVSSWLNPIAAALRLITRGGSTESVAQAPRKTPGDIRRDLIENYMYLISAPLLAIAMYYLLQVLAEQVTQPVLVIMALATGLVSKAVIGGIIEFAESRLLSERRREALPTAQAGADAAAKLAEARARQSEAKAAAQVADNARTRHAAAEQAAKDAAAAALKARDKETAVQAAVGTGQASETDAAAARQEADSAASKAAEAQAIADEAAEETQRAGQEAKLKRSEAEVATDEGQKAVAVAARQAEAKQSDAKAAAEATEEAAKVATEKQAEAQTAVEAAMKPALDTASAFEATSGTADAEKDKAKSSPPVTPPPSGPQKNN